MSTLHQAKAARDKIAGMLKGVEDVTGVGIVRLASGYGVRVNLRTDEGYVLMLADGSPMPKRVGGVPVSTRVTGAVVAH